MDKFLTKSTPDNHSGVSKRPREGPSPPDQWTKPKKFVANPKEGPKNKEAPTNNRFKGLPVDADEISADSFQNATKKKASNNTPLIIIELDGDWTHEKIRDVIAKYNKDFHMQNRGLKLVRVQCYTAHNHQLLKDGLQSENVAFHTYTRKDEKLPRAVIKGLPTFLHHQVAEELASLGFVGATTSELKTFYSSECPPVLVQLPNGTNMTKFKQIRYLSNCVVDIQRYKPTKKPGTQCFRCQGFGHASRNCNRPARCVKCAQSHPTWECTKKDRDEPARCCNCQQEHPANYTQCIERLKYLERIESKRETLRKTITHETPIGKSSSQKTWAQVTGAANRKSHAFKSQTSISSLLPEINQPNEPTTKKTIMSATNQRTPANANGAVTNKNSSPDFETIEMLEILTTIQSIKQEFKTCNTLMEKVILILTHLGHYV